MLHDACVKWFSSKKKHSEEQIKEMEKFVVLMAASAVNVELKQLCVFNSVFFDEKMFMSAIKNKKFDTKIKELNQRVAKWKSIKDLFDDQNF